MSFQAHAYDSTYAYHFANLALAGEAQALWEVDAPDHEDIENPFAIPHEYYNQLFAASRISGDDIYNDVQGHIQQTYECLGAIRIGDMVVSDNANPDNAWSLDDMQSMTRVIEVMNSYSRRFSEIVTNSVRFTFSKLLMGFALRSRVDGHGVIVLRGTMTVEEWLNNMDFRLVPFLPDAAEYGRVHSGFREIHTGVRGRYRQLAQAMEADRPLYLVGHSLGGAVSQLAAVDLALLDPAQAHRIQAYLFAPPRVGDATFAAQHDALVATSYRVVNVCDVVPYLPFEELHTMVKDLRYPYADTKGEMIYIHQAGNPIANHISSYHLATKARLPQPGRGYPIMRSLQ